MGNTIKSECPDFENQPEKLADLKKFHFKSIYATKQLLFMIFFGVIFTILSQIEIFMKVKCVYFILN
jgi:hypothetical protein